MLVSIVVPAYNAAQYLGLTMESIFVQTYSEWQLIVVDDGSTDETRDVASAYARREGRVEVVHQPNGGLASARNRGLRACAAAGKYVAFLDADDVWEKDALERLVRRLEASPDAAAAHGLSRFIDADGQRVYPGVLETWGRRREGVIGKRVVAWPVDQPTTIAVLSFRNCIQTPGQVLIRREALEAAGYFDPGAAPCEDWDMWLRLAQFSDCAFLDYVVLNYRRHHHNMSADQARVAAGEQYLRRKLLLTPSLSRQQYRSVLIANWHWCRRVCASRLQSARSSVANGQWRQAFQEVSRVASNYSRSCFGLPPE